MVPNKVDAGGIELNKIGVFSNDDFCCEDIESMKMISRGAWAVREKGFNPYT